MIVRIMGEGQLEIGDEYLDALNALDDDLQAAVDSGDEATFRTALTALLDRVREVGTPVPDDALTPSELILPAPESTVDEVRALLKADGLIPG